MVPTLPAASDHVTASFAVSVSGVPAVVVGFAGVIDAPELEATAVPVPESEIVCGELLVLSAIVNVAVSDATTEGVSDTAIVQLDPTARDDPQLLLVQKSSELAPLSVIAEIEIGPLPAFENTIACEGVVVPTVCPVKVMLDGLNIADPDPVVPPPGVVLVEVVPPPCRVHVLVAVQPNRFEPAAAALLKKSCPTWQVLGRDVPTAAGRVNERFEKSAFRPCVPRFNVVICEKAGEKAKRIATMTFPPISPFDLFAAPNGQPPKRLLFRDSDKSYSFRFPLEASKSSIALGRVYMIENQRLTGKFEICDHTSAPAEQGTSEGA